MRRHTVLCVVAGRLLPQIRVGVGGEGEWELELGHGDERGGASLGAFVCKCLVKLPR
jgi:hypothetical protein